MHGMLLLGMYSGRGTVFAGKDAYGVMGFTDTVYGEIRKRRRFYDVNK